MKKILFLATIVAVLFASCNKYELSDPVNIEDYPKVTVSGKVLAELDNLKAGLEAVPQGTVIGISVPYSNYNPNYSGEGFYTAQTTVGADGTYSIEIPVVKDGVSAKFVCEEFVAEVVVNKDIKENKRFTRFNETITVPGTPTTTAMHKEFTYTTSTFVNPAASTVIPTSTVTYSGKLDYLSQVTPSLDNVFSTIPSGKKITVEIKLYRLKDDFSGPNTDYQYVDKKEITVGANGAYSIDVPMIERGIATITMGAMEYLEFTSSTGDKNIFRYTLNAAATLYSSPASHPNEDFTYAKGTLIY